MEFRYQRTEIHDLLHSALAVVAPEAYRKGLDVGAVLESNLPQSVVCDASKLRQALTALLSNAVKFTQHGSVLLWAEMLPGNRLYVEVKDTGIGISAEDQKHLFQAFGMIDASTTRSQGGTGLGLALSHRLVSSMGGRVGVKSIKGLGSSFFIELPVDVLPGQPLVVAQRQQFRPRHEGAAVLLIGDLPATQMVLGMAAQQWGLDFHWEQRESRVSRHLDEILAARDYHWIFIAQEMTDRFWEKMMPYLQQKSHMRIIQLRPPSEKYGQRPLPHLYVPFSTGHLFDAMLGRREPEVVPAPVASPVAAAVYKLLVVDDNEVNRKVAVGFLRKMGHDVDTAEDGRQAVDAVESARYDFVFMDCQMPVMDGYEATRQIKARFPRLPVVAVTANAMEGDRERCLAAGMDDYMTKPVKREKLQDMLDRWLNASLKSQA
jgi:CheY-like chemotaxis protein/anti-sigma regulatory factor (Ser/Thr protein kinase)